VAALLVKPLFLKGFIGVGRAATEAANNLDQYSAVGAVTPTYDGNGKSHL
jgi:hypothetical protein